MSSREFALLLFVSLLIGFVCTSCPSNWTVFGRHCCSPTFGLNSTASTFHLVHGVDYPICFIVWNDASHSSLGIDTDWTTLNIHWGQMTGNRSIPYAPSGLVDVVRIFHRPGKGLFGLQFHDSLGQY